MNARTLSRAHGAFNLASGLWPLLSLRTFEAVMGPKEDDWLVKAVAGLLVAAGVAQLTAADTPEAQRTSRTIGLGVPAALAAVDLVYVPKGRISPIYLLDAAAHLSWITAWTRQRPAAGEGR